MNRKMLLYYAHGNVLMRWAREMERIHDNPELEMPIAHYKEEKYRNELNEIEAEMKALDQKKTKVVNVEVMPEQFQTIAEALKMCASWLEDFPEDRSDIEWAKKIREVRKAMLDNAEVIDYE